MSNIIHLNESNFDDSVKDGVVLVDFSAEWCGPCKMLTPIIEELANDYSAKAKICKVDIDKDDALAMRFNVRGVPTVLIYKDGEVVETLVGFRSKDDFKKILDSNIS
jgi:thioredoxin 1